MYFSHKTTFWKSTGGEMPFTAWTEIIHSPCVCCWTNLIFLLYSPVEAAFLDFECICHWSFLICPRRLLNNNFLNSSFHSWKETRKAFLDVWENSGKLPSNTSLLKWMSRFWGHERGKREGKGTFHPFLAVRITSSAYRNEHPKPKYYKMNIIAP